MPQTVLNTYARVKEAYPDDPAKALRRMFLTKLMYLTGEISGFRDDLFQGKHPNINIESRRPNRIR